MMVHENGASLTERVLLHSDATLIGLDLLEEATVRVQQVSAPVVDLIPDPQVQFLRSQ